MNDVFCDKRDCLFWDVDGICNCVMHDGIPYCKSESIDTKNDAADGLREENAKLREMLSESRQANERLYAELKRYKRIFRTRPIDVNAMFDENMKMRELVEDNKKLRVEWESERDYANQMETIAERLQAENAKLRKYAESYVGVVKAGGCDFCPYCDDFEACEDADTEPMSEGCALYMQMSELRIEV